MIGEEEASWIKWDADRGGLYGAIVIG